MASRRRQNSFLPQPKSSHVQDEFLKEFLSSSFDPVDYLNSSLSALSPAATIASGSTAPSAISLADLSSHAQTITSQLNAHTTRLTNTLTQLTDDILRSSSRLSYQVELLRGETLSTSEVLRDRLATDVAVFLPTSGEQSQCAVADAPATNSGEPTSVARLRTLTTVKDRLDSVIKAFGAAMEFVFPPSELSTSSSFLSVSAPEPGSQEQSTEQKGQEVLQKLRDEISTLLADPDDPIQGIEKAAQRVEELKDLSVIWKGTAEEKGRAKFIESLAQKVEERHRELLREVETGAKKNSKGAEPDVGHRKAAEGGNKSYAPGLGLLNQLQKMRVGI